MRQYVVRFDPRAERDMEELECFVAATSGWERADIVIAAVAEAAERLDLNPHRGARIRGRAGAGRRWILTAKGTQVLYRIDEAAGQVVVIAVAHRGRAISRLVKDRP